MGTAEGLAIVAILIDGAVLAFVVYDFLAKKRNRPRLRFWVNKAEDGPSRYIQNWIVDNVGRDSALSFSVRFVLRSQSGENFNKEFALVAQPLSFGKDLIPARISNDWAGLGFLFEKGAPLFLVQVDTRTEVQVTSEGKLVEVHPSHTLPVGKYLVLMSASASNLRDEDRTLQTYVLEFVDGIPAMRPRDERDPIYAIADNVRIPRADKKG